MDMEYRERAAADEAWAAAKKAELSRKIAPHLLPQATDPAFDNGAVARCCMAYLYKLEDLTSQDKDLSHCMDQAQKIYRNTMPPLSGAENIRDFIACVAYGLLIQAINTDESTKLLYAAQVAYSAVQKFPVHS